VGGTFFLYVITSSVIYSLSLLAALPLSLTVMV